MEGEKNHSLLKLDSIELALYQFYKFIYQLVDAACTLKICPGYTANFKRLAHPFVCIALAMSEAFVG